MSRITPAVPLQQKNKPIFKYTPLIQKRKQPYIINFKAKQLDFYP